MSSRCCPPIAAGTGAFSDVRGAQITLRLAEHEVEATSFLAGRLTR
jgi:hypothetical protein